MNSQQKKEIKIEKRFFKAQAVWILVVLAFTFLTILAKNNAYFPFDVVITRTIQNYQPAWFDQLMRFITLMGNIELASWIVLIIISIFVFLRKYHFALLVVISVVGVNILSLFFKLLVDRPRPDPDLIRQISTFSRADSFPSGHVLNFIGLYGLLLFLVITHMKKSWLKNFVSIYLLFLLVLIGISRIYLGAHWFSDTLGSYLLGTLWLGAIGLFYKKYFKLEE